MSREKQIEEMARVMCEDCAKDLPCVYSKKGELCNSVREQAEAIYNAGYRKQEWISVDERLPELESTRSDGYHRPRSVRVLCVCEQRSGKVFVKEGYYELFGKTVCWRIPGSIDSITHWMPLPEAPKMKGGEE